MKQAESARKAHSCIIMQTQKPVDTSGLSVDANKQRQCSRALPGGRDVCAPFFRFFARGQTKQPERRKKNFYHAQFLSMMSVVVHHSICLPLFNPRRHETGASRKRRDV